MKLQLHDPPREGLRPNQVERMANRVREFAECYRENVPVGEVVHFG